MIVPHISAPKFLPQFACPALPAVIGHRGAAARAPENTLAGFRRAKALGCDWVEFDVRLTGDGALVLCHDTRLDRTTTGRGRVIKQSLAAIRDCDAGIRFGPEFAGERVPTLDEALLLIAELGMGADIEIKSDRFRQHASGAAVAETLRRLEGRLPRVLVSSFQPLALDALRGFRPPIPMGILFRNLPRNSVEFSIDLGCAVIGADHHRLRPGRVAAIREVGYQLAAYTVNNPVRARLLFDWGVTSVFSDAPDIILSMIAAPQPERPALPAGPASAQPGAVQ